MNERDLERGNDEIPNPADIDREAAEMNTESADGNPDGAFADVLPKKERVVYEHLDVIPGAEEIGELDGSHVYDEETAGALVAMMFARDHAEDENAPVVTDPPKSEPKPEPEVTEAQPQKPKKKVNKALVGLLSGAAALVALALSIITYLFLGDCFSYTVDGDGKAIITGYYGLNSEIKIPEEIGGYPVVEIGGRSFYESSAERITIPDSVRNIGFSAFGRCYSLVSVDMGNGVTSIGDRAFENCSSIKSIAIPSSVENVGNEAFSGCGSLTDIYITDVSAWCNISEPGNLTRHGSSQKMLYLNGEPVFSLEIPEGVTSIEEYAFSSFSFITRTVIPTSVDYIGDYAFWGCDKLNILARAEAEPEGWDSEWNRSDLPVVWGYVADIPEYMFGYVLSENDVIITSYSGTDSHVAVPSVIDGMTVTAIDNNAFNGCSFIESVVIRDGIERIGDYAFSGCTALESVVIPESVMSIGEYAFRATALRSVNIPSGISYISNSTFANCSSLERVVIPDGVTSINMYAFAGCSAMKEVVLGGEVTEIGDNAFSDCTALTSINIPDSIREIGSSAFAGCDSLADIYLASISSWCNMAGVDNMMRNGSDAKRLFLNGDLLVDLVIPDGVIEVDDYAFYRCTSLRSALIPRNISAIGEYAFYGCESMGALELGEGLTDIEFNAFSGCSSLSRVVIPESVTFIGNYAFDNCPSLSIYCKTDSTPSGWSAYWNNGDRPTVFEYYETGKEHFSYTATEDEIIINGYSGGENGIVIPPMIDCKPVTQISNDAFSSSTSLVSVVIPDSVKTIGASAFYYCLSLSDIEIPEGVVEIGDYAFFNCSSLEKIVIPKSVTCVASSAFDNCTALSIYCRAESQPTGWYANWNSYGCPVSWGYIPEIPLSELGYTENANGITITDYYGSDSEIAIPALIEGKPVTAILSSVFSGNTVIKRVSLPDTITDMGSFAYCSNLETINIPRDTLRVGSFLECYALKTIRYNARSADNNSYSSVIYCGVGKNYSGGATVIIGKDVERIPDYAFAVYDVDGYITKVTFEEGSACTSIGEGAFNNCQTLFSIDIPDSVLSIGASAFHGCSSLSQAKIGAGVTSIGDGAFENTKKLSEITVSANNISYKSMNGDLYSADGKTLIKYATGKADTSFEIPEGVESIASGAFYGCQSLKSVIIPSGVTSIGEDAFYNCNALESVIIPSSVTTVGSRAFYCFKIEIFCEAESKPSGWASDWNSGDRPVTWGYTA